MISVEHMDELIVRIKIGEIDIRDVIEQSYIEGRADAEKELQGIKDLGKLYSEIRAEAINAIKNDLHKQLTEEMNKPYQDQNLCQGLYFGIQRCDWYLDDSKEQSNTCTATVDGVKREFM